MKYLTGHYQLREFYFNEMLESIIVKNNITPGEDCFIELIPSIVDRINYYPEIKN